MLVINVVHTQQPFQRQSCGSGNEIKKNRNQLTTREMTKHQQEYSDEKDVRLRIVRSYFQTAQKEVSTMYNE